MSKMGYGYGSECHLLRWMGRHRQNLDRRVGEAIGRRDEPIGWMDFRFDPKATWPDSEIKGIKFLESGTVRTMRFLNSGHS